MSAHKQSEKDTGLPLPSPRSPAQLDDKILAYARDHAPSKRFPLQPAWVAGLATTGVVVLALFITLPQQPAPTVVMEPSGPVKMASPAMDADMQSEQAAAREKPAAGVVRKDLPAVQMSRSLKVEQEYREERVMADEGFSQLPPGAVGAAAAPASASVQEVLNADSAVPGAPTAPEPTMQQRLAPYAALLQQGQEARARAGYQALRESCTDCQLPATLEQALIDYPLEE